MDGGSGFGDGAVVELDFLRDAFEEDAGGGTGAGWDVDAFGGGEGAGADCDGDIYGDRTGVMRLDRDQPADTDAVAGGDVAGGDVADGEISEAAVMVDPVIEDLRKVFV